MAVICIAVRRGIFRDKVRFVATKRHEAAFGTLLGDKIFVLDEGEEFTLFRPTSEMWEPGDRAKKFHHLITTLNQHKFCWYWA